MIRPFALVTRSLLALLTLVALFGDRLGSADEAPHYTNLKVLPKDVDPQVLRATMASFTRALGVRCNYCHVETPQHSLDFTKDDRPTKEKARVMMRMVADINGKYLATLDSRSHPPVQVSCFTCHHGVAQPRTLQETLEIAYSTGGIDSTRARYAALRDRYFGRAAYDFGEVPLADVASAVRDSGHVADALALLDLDVQMNPSSAFAKRMYAQSAVLAAFGSAGADSGVAAYRAMKARFGAEAISPPALGAIGAQLVHTGKVPAGIAALELATTESPGTNDSYDALGDAYLLSGDRKRAIDSFRRAAALDSSDTHATDQLKAMHVKPAKKAKKP